MRTHWKRFGPAMATVLTLVVVAGWSATRGTRLAAGAAAEDGAADRDAEAMARERRDVARRALEIIARSWEVGAPVRDQAGDVHVWSTRLLGTEIYLSLPGNGPRVEDAEVYLALPDIPPDPSRLRAFEQHLERMRRWEDRLRPLAASGVLSSLGFLDVESRRIQAELWLYREKAKGAKVR